MIGPRALEAAFSSPLLPPRRSFAVRNCSTHTESLVRPEQRSTRPAHGKREKIHCMLDFSTLPTWSSSTRVCKLKRVVLETNGKPSKKKRQTDKSQADLLPSSRRKRSGHRFGLAEVDDLGVPAVARVLDALPGGTNALLREGELGDRNVTVQVEAMAHLERVDEVGRVQVRRAADRQRASDDLGCRDVGLTRETRSVRGKEGGEERKDRTHRAG